MINLDSSIGVIRFSDIRSDDVLYLDGFDKIPESHMYEFSAMIRHLKSGIFYVVKIENTGNSYITLKSEGNPYTFYESDLRWLNIYILPRESYPHYFI